VEVEFIMSGRSDSSSSDDCSICEVVGVVGRVDGEVVGSVDEREVEGED